MTKLILMAFVCFSLQLHAQVDLSFDHRFVACEDKWVAFEMNEDSAYHYGFIYIDAEAGLTLNNEGSFKPLKDGSFEISKMEGASLKVRLQPNNVKVAIIPNDLFEKLDIEETPDWLKHYKKDVNTAERQYKWGFMYNGWNECERALPFLLKARELDADYKGLAVEIAYSYNCLKQYSKAIELLGEEIEKHPNDAYMNKEFIYSVSKTKDIEKATAQYAKSIKTLDDDVYNAENCYNILQFYYKKEDQKNFKKWYKELNKWPVQNELITKYADIMKGEMKSK